MNLDEFIISLAQPGDGEKIAHVHHEAIKITAALYYDKKVIDVWTKYPDESAISRVETAIADRIQIFVVARVKGEIVGFGSIIPAQHEFRSCYVSPRHGRKGIGSAIVQYLLQQARQHNAAHLDMHSSINAELFYKKNGFYTKMLGVHRFSNGVEMSCAVMRIEL